MWYSLGIWELVYDKEEDYNSVVIVTHTDLPKYGEPTDQTNERWPSYGWWADFTRFCDLEHLMGVLIDEHPGVVKLTQEHIDELELRYKEYISKYPSAVAWYNTKRDEDAYLVRLEWMRYWMTWALKNCKNPVFCNS